MSFQAAIAHLVDILSAKPQNLTEDGLAILATGITTDSRHVNPGDIFLALRGENFDGHDFIAVALEKGAIAAIVDSHCLPLLPDSFTLPLLIVADTLQAYQTIAHWWRQQFSIPVIAITGSVGKTTTKELIAAALSQYGNVLKTQANYNNEIGVPQTLLELNANHDFAVIEMGMRGAGQIALLSQIAAPNIAVITNVGTAHIGLLGSREAIAAAKCELLAEMPSDAVAILNQDIPLLTETAAKVWTGKTLTYGLTGGILHGNLNGDRMEVAGQQFRLPLPGTHNALNFLAAIAVIQCLELDRQLITQGLSVDLPSGRARRYELPNDVLILDETYNAGLESMLAALHLLAQTPGKRRIAVLGTMKELGDWSIRLHREIGEAARRLQLDALLILAEPAETEAIVEGFFPLKSEQFASHAEVVTWLKQTVQPGDRLLFKASRTVRLDQVVEQFRVEYA